MVKEITEACKTQCSLEMAHGKMSFCSCAKIDVLPLGYCPQTGSHIMGKGSHCYKASWWNFLELVILDIPEMFLNLMGMLQGSFLCMILFEIDTFEHVKEVPIYSSYINRIFKIKNRCWSKLNNFLGSEMLM